MTVGFFDEAVADAQRRAVRITARMQRQPPPDDWYVLAAGVPFDEVIWQGPTAAAAIGGLTATPSGFEFTLHLRWHEASPAAVRHPLDRSRYDIGLIFSDGREAWSNRGARDADDARLRSLGGSSGGGPFGTTELRYRATPLPPAGPLVLVFTWRDAHAGDAEPIQVELDSDAIRAAAGRAQMFFDDPHFEDEEQA